MNIARLMKAYEDQKYNEWKANIEAILPEILKTNLLAKPSDKIDPNLIMPVNSDPETGRFYFDFFLYTR